MVPGFCKITEVCTLAKTHNPDCGRDPTPGFKGESAEKTIHNEFTERGCSPQRDSKCDNEER